MQILKRLNSGQPAIGEWTFALNDIVNTESNEISAAMQSERFAYFFHSVIPILEILQNAELFNLEEIIVDDFRDYDLPPPDCWLRNQNLKITSKHPLNEIADKTKNTILEKYSKFIFPAELTFRGSSILITEAGAKNQFKGIFTLICYPGDFVTIITDCDAWLPFDLKGNSQKTLSEINAPRLTKAMEEIEIILGLKPDFENSKYAKVNKYQLENYMHSTDEPVVFNLENRV